MHINPYLNFNGDCKRAFEFYRQVLGGELVMMQTYGDTPVCDQMPAEWRDKIAHARLIIGGQVLMGSDAPPEHFHKAQGFDIALNFESTSEAERIFNALAENGTVKMPFEETFWAKGFGTLVDQFGIPWMTNCEKEQSNG